MKTIAAMLFLAATCFAAAVPGNGKITILQLGHMSVCNNYANRLLGDVVERTTLGT